VDRRQEQSSTASDSEYEPLDEDYIRKGEDGNLYVEGGCVGSDKRLYKDEGGRYYTEVSSFERIFNLITWTLFGIGGGILFILIYHNYTGPGPQNPRGSFYWDLINIVPGGSYIFGGLLILVSVFQIYRNVIQGRNYIEPE